MKYNADIWNTNAHCHFYFRVHRNSHFLLPDNY